MRIRSRVWVFVGSTVLAGAQRDLSFRSSIGGTGCRRRRELWGELHSGADFSEHALLDEVRCVRLLRGVDRGDDVVCCGFPAGDEGEEFGVYGGGMGGALVLEALYAAARGTVDGQSVCLESWVLGNIGCFKGDEAWAKLRG